MACASAAATPRAATSPVLYQNGARDITLLDIPRSIAAAQGRSGTLMSTSPLQVPIPTKHEHRPTAQRTRARNADECAHATQHAEYKALIEQALAELRINVSGSWCEPRQLMTQAPLHREEHDIENDDPERELETRLREWSAWVDSKGDSTAFDLQQMMASLGATPEDDATAAAVVPHKWVMSYRPAPECTAGTQAVEAASQQELTEPWTPVFRNPATYPLELTVAENPSQHARSGPKYSFIIPPHSTFFLHDAAHPDIFRKSFRELTDKYALSRHFDLVLLDPPWPNRSAKRKGAYEQVGGMPYLKRMLLRLDIDSYLEHNALVGIWITNKESLRAHVLGPGGLFEIWNVGLIEEWLWIKTTAAGEPMFDIDNEMRKPYEVLLVGRAAATSWTVTRHSQSVKRRVIAAVPDVHSRKPCLKTLLEPYMPDARDYSALEVFSRNLVSGWSSWGNEVLKYNWERYWTAD